MGREWLDRCRSACTICDMDRMLYLRTAYDGTDFHGWQRQVGELRTVQGVVEDTLRRILRHPVDLVGSSRTDAGVHAAGHVGHFVTMREVPAEALRQAIGSRLPTDVAVLEVRDVHPEFHATRRSVSKFYRYRIHASVDRPVKNFTQRYAYHCWVPLDIMRMQEAGGHFVGTQDFTSMTPIASKRENHVRTVFRCDVTQSGDEIHIDIEGDGFLYHQVRNMVGTLIEVGRGRWEPRYVREIIAARDRRRAGQTAPARGLCLQSVTYPEELMYPPLQDQPAD